MVSVKNISVERTSSKKTIVWGWDGPWTHSMVNEQGYWRNSSVVEAARVGEWEGSAVWDDKGEKVFVLFYFYRSLRTLILFSFSSPECSVSSSVSVDSRDVIIGVKKRKMFLLLNWATEYHGVIKIICILFREENSVRFQEKITNIGKILCPMSSERNLFSS